MPMLQVFRRIWSRPLRSIAHLLVILGVVLTIHHLAQYVSETQEVDRVEELLWKQLEPIKMTTRLAEIELAELTDVMDAAAAAKIRQDLKRIREELRQEVRRMAHELVNRRQEQEQRREPERPAKKTPNEPDVPYAELIGETSSAQAAEIQELRVQRQRVAQERRGVERERRRLAQERRRREQERRRLERGKKRLEREQRRKH